MTGDGIITSHPPIPDPEVTFQEGSLWIHEISLIEPLIYRMGVCFQFPAS